MKMEMFIFIQYRISMLFLLVFLYFFLPLKYKKMVTFVIMGVCFAATMVIEATQEFIFPSELAPLSTFIDAVIVQISVFALCKYRDFRALFIGISSAIFVISGDIVSAIVLISFNSYWIALIVQIIVHVLFLIFIVMFISKRSKGEMTTKKQGWGPLCTIPSLFYVLIYVMAVWPESLYNNPENIIPITVTLLLSFTSYALIISLFSQQRVESELQRSNEFLETYSNGLKREIEFMSVAEDKLALLRHDLRHTNNLMLSYIKAGEKDKALELAGKMEKDLLDTKVHKFCENIAINGILAIYEEKCKNNKISLDIKVDVPKTLGKINEFEFATVLSNILENAFMATSVNIDSKKSIVVKMKPVKNQILMEISNTFDGKCTISEETGLPISRKGEGHGYGLRSVQAYARKWDAVFKYEIDGNIFKISILT